MIFTKTPMYKRLKKPIDNFTTLKDGKRILGDNKTWIGFVSMMLCYCIFQITCGLICRSLDLNSFNELYNIYSNTFALNFLFGLLCGFLYMLLELPNSFIKRRLDIPSGKTVIGLKGVIFFIIDQIDSLLGVMLALTLFSGIGIGGYIRYLFVGAITHICINLILYFLRIRKNV